jgi:CHASE2 domain-containing sensor protein/two-component sensor histidine kinase
MAAHNSSQRSAAWGPRRTRLNLERLLMALLLPLVLLWLAERPGLMQLDGVIYDRMLALAPSDPSADIVIVAIDARSLRELGPWPWRRDRHAQLLDRLARDAPRAVLLDLFLTEPSADPRDDRLLAEAMKKVPVYLPMRYESSAAAISGEPSDFVPPLPVFASQAAGIGHANLLPDADGIARTLYLHEGYGGRLQPYVGLLLACRCRWSRGPAKAVAANEASDVVDAMAPSGPEKSGGMDWLRRQVVRIPFSGPPGSYRTLSYVDVLRGDAPIGLLRDRLLLVGVTARELAERMPVPNAGATGTLPGIEVHANAIDSVREGRHIVAASPTAYAVWVVLWIWAALWLLGRTTRHAVLLALAAAACLVLSALAMWRQHWWLPPAAPMAGLMVLYLLWSWRRLESVVAYLRQRARTLDAVAAGAFESMPSSLPLQATKDEFSRPRQALDRAIDRLTRMQALLDEALAVMPVAMLICDEDGCVRSSNAAAHELLADASLPNHREIGTLAAAGAGWHLPGLIDTLPRVAAVPAGSSRSPGGEHWSTRLRGEYTTRDGHRAFRLETAAFCSDAAAGERGWVVVLPELTAERRAQRQRDEWRQFLSHDLRSPQITILSLLSIHGHGAEAATGPLLQAVRREAERTLALAEGFMDITEAESGDYRFAEIIMGALLLDARDQVWPYASANDVHIQLRMDEGAEILVRADGALLTRAIVNLLNNAIRHSPRGGRIDVCLAEMPGTPGRTENALCVIRIADEGEGMAEAQLQALLAMPHGRQFERPAEKKGPRSTGDPSGHSGNTPKARGMGLGLAVVCAVVRRHGGCIEATSAPGAGSTFWLLLPLQRGARP